MRRALALATLLGLSAACRAEPPPPSDGPRLVTPASVEAPPAAAPAASAPAPRVVPTEQVVTWTSKDKTRLVGSWYQGPADAPVVLLAHRLSGQRRDWVPLVTRLLAEGPPVSVMALDLRGHGESSAPGNETGGRVGGALNRDDVVATGDDLLTAIAEIDRRLGRPAVRVIGVGSDLGATSVVLAAGREPRLDALALISPVAALRGVDLYAPYAAVRQRPSLLIGAKEDPVSREPVPTLGSMVGARATVTTLDGAAHGLPALGAEAWSALQRWLITTAAGAP